MTSQAIILFCVFAAFLNVQVCGKMQALNDFRARYSLNVSDGYYELPWNTSSPLINSYVEVPSNLGLPLRLYCYPNDPRVCLMFDLNGSVAGIQISYLYDDVRSTISFYRRSFIKNILFDQVVLSLRVYFTDPTTLTIAGRQDMSQIVEGLWVVLDGTLYRLQTDEPPPRRKNLGPFYRQGCVPGKGQLYIYSINSKANCNEITPFYKMYARGVLSGFGIDNFGRGTNLPGSRVWYEYPSDGQINDALVDRPPCIEQVAQTYGVTGLHVYFIDHPWDITCPA